MEVRELLQRIKTLHGEIEEECNERLDLLEDCSKEERECRECPMENRCRVDVSKMIKISQLYDQLNSGES